MLYLNMHAADQQVSQKCWSQSTKLQGITFCMTVVMVLLI